jgi:hypothetical protein
LTGPSRKQPDQGAQLRPSFDFVQLDHIAVDEIGNILVEESRSPGRGRSGECCRKAAAYHSIHVARAVLRVFQSAVLVDAWVKLDDTGGLEYEVLGDVVELCFGGQRGNFQIQAKKRALGELVTKGAEALRRMEASETDD